MAKAKEQDGQPRHAPDGCSVHGPDCGRGDPTVALGTKAGVGPPAGDAHVGRNKGNVNR